jgi:ribosomal protein L33
MAKAVSLKIKLVSSADTGHYYVTKKHVEYKESKIK